MLNFCRGFNNFFRINNLSSGHTYTFKLCMVSNNNERKNDSMHIMTTVSCITKSRM